MDPIKILRRAWQILWSYRTLWVFGLILALAGTATSMNTGSNDRTQYLTDSQDIQGPFPENMRQAFQQFTREAQRLFREGYERGGFSQQDWTTLLWVAGIFVLILMIVGVIVAIARYVAETAVIRMVDEYENTNSKMTVRAGLHLGWSRTSWRLFLINLLVNLPAILAVMLLIVFGVAVYMAFTRSSEEATAVTAGILILLSILTILVVGIVTIFLRLLRNFFWRVCALENATVGESLRRGFQMARNNWKNVGVMWLVMIGLAIAWGIVSIVAVILSIPLLVLTGVVGALVAVIPGLIAGGITSLFAAGWVPLIAGVLFALPLFLVVAFSPWLLIGSWQTVFTSTVWTLVYRELKALPALTGANGSAEAE